MTAAAMTLAAYWDALDAFDWHYGYSDDGGVFRRGSQREGELIAIREQSAEHAAMYAAFKAHHFSGKPWGTDKVAKPVKPQ